MRKHIIILAAALAISVSPFLFRELTPDTRESIIFFPLHPEIAYSKAGTELKLLDSSGNNGFTLEWRISSVLEQQAYLRQDIGLVYKNGRLVGKLGKWEQDKAELVQEKRLDERESAVFSAVAFHYSEIHTEGEEIYSSQEITGDRLYVVDSSFSRLSSFRVPHSGEEKEWKFTLDRLTGELIEKALIRALETNSLQREDYEAIFLTDLPEYKTKPFPGFTQKESEIIKGKLWEGIYKNYFLGIKRGDGIMVAPEGSTIPVILLSKQKEELLLVTETKSGEPVMLRQVLR